TSAGEKARAKYEEGTRLSRLDPRRGDAAERQAIPPAVPTSAAPCAPRRTRAGYFREARIVLVISLSPYFSEVTLTSSPARRSLSLASLSLMNTWAFLSSCLGQSLALASVRTNSFLAGSATAGTARTSTKTRATSPRRVKEMRFLGGSSATGRSPRPA